MGPDAPKEEEKQDHFQSNRHEQELGPEGGEVEEIEYIRSWGRGGRT